MAKASGGGGRRSGRVRATPSAGAGLPPGVVPITFADSDAAADWAWSVWENTQDDLSVDHIDALRDYQSNGYRPMNKALREGTLADNPIRQAQVWQIDEAIEIAPRVAATVDVYRGVSAKAAQATAGWTPGSSFVDPQFLSTTLDAEQALDFTKGPSGTRIRITVPQGSHGLWMDAGSGNSLGEMEILLPRSSRYTVVSNTVTTAGREVHLLVNTAA